MEFNRCYQVSEEVFKYYISCLVNIVFYHYEIRLSLLITSRYRKNSLVNLRCGYLLSGPANFPSKRVLMALALTCHNEIFVISYS